METPLACLGTAWSLLWKTSKRLLHFTFEGMVVVAATFTGCSSTKETTQRGFLLQRPVEGSSNPLEEKVSASNFVGAKYSARTSEVPTFGGRLVRVRTKDPERTYETLLETLEWQACGVENISSHWSFRLNGRDRAPGRNLWIACSLRGCRQCLGRCGPWKFGHSWRRSLRGREHFFSLEFPTLTPFFFSRSLLSVCSGAQQASCG